MREEGGRSVLGVNSNFAQHLSALRLVERLADLLQGVHVLGVRLQLPGGEQLREGVEGLVPLQVSQPEGDLADTRLGVLGDLALVAALQDQEHSPFADRVHGLVRGAGVAVVVVDDVDAVVGECVEQLLLLVIDDKVRAEGLHHVDPRPRRRRHHPRRAERFRQLDADVPSAARPARDRHSEVLLRPGSASGAQAFKGGHPHHRHRARVHSRQAHGADTRRVAGQHHVLRVRTIGAAPHLVTHLQPAPLAHLHHGAGSFIAEHPLRARERRRQVETRGLDQIDINRIHTAALNADECLARARGGGVDDAKGKARPVRTVAGGVDDKSGPHLRRHGACRRKQSNCRPHAYYTSVTLVVPESEPKKYRN
eukprot:Hpha_TRINITY_DN15350_c3_g4::TRINITY_DN15350_c3_g4_i3::g.88849::m.88849